MGQRFIALRDLKEGAGVVCAGSFVPGAEEWPHSIVVANVNAGNVYDLHRQFKLNGDATLSSHRRERELLDGALKVQGSILIDDPDHPGRQLLAPSGAAATAIPTVQTARPSKTAAATAARKAKQAARSSGSVSGVAGIAAG